MGPSTVRPGNRWPTARALHAGEQASAARAEQALVKATAGNPAADGVSDRVERYAQDLVALPFATFCDDWALPVDDHDELDRAWRLSRKVAPNMRSSTLALSAVTGCLGWPGEVNNPQHRLDVDGSPPLLMLNSLAARDAVPPGSVPDRW